MYLPIMPKKSHIKVAPTAYSVARARGVSDIPFAKKIAKWLGKELSKQKGFVSYPIGSKLTVTVEARYKLINKIVLRHNPAQILELACGLLPRGYLFSKQGITYVETDLSNLVELKKKMYKTIFPKLSQNLFLEEANALSKKELDRAAKHFDKNKPLVITHEGLLRYLSFKEKTKVAKNIHSLLEEFGGVWITCDITLIKLLPKRDLKNIKSRIGMDVSKNAFRNLTHAKKFFSNLGFKVKVHKLQEIQSSLSAPKVLGLTKKEVEQMLDFYVVEMTLK